MLTPVQQQDIKVRLQTDPSIFPDNWSYEDAVEAIKKSASHSGNVDVFRECVLIEWELETVQLD